MGLLILYLFASNIYERKITVSNPADTPAVDVQVHLNLDTRDLIDQGKLDPEAYSLRFYHHNNLIPYWIEDTIQTNSTSIWLKMDTLLPGEDFLDLYYANEENTGPNFDSVFTKISVDPGQGWVFHCDEGLGNSTYYEEHNGCLTLNGTSWKEGDGGGWQNREDLTFSSGSALCFSKGTYAMADIPVNSLRDSFTVALWLKLDTSSNLAYSASQRIIAEVSDFFKIWLQSGNLCFSVSHAATTSTCMMPPFGWERVGSPLVSEKFIPQGLTSVGEELFLAVDLDPNQPSQVWRINPADLSRTGWFDMPPEAKHTSGLAYDSVSDILWASDFKSNMIYAIDYHKSYETHSANIIGTFSINQDSLSACCFAPFGDTSRLLISTWGVNHYTYIVDEKTSLATGQPKILGRYRNAGSSQGLDFDGKYVWESGNASLIKFDLEKAAAFEDYRAGFVSFCSEPLLPEDLAFLHDTLWTTTESRSKSFFRLTGDPQENLDHWMFLAATYDGEIIRFYRNSVLQDSIWVGRPGKDQNQDWPFFVGSQNNKLHSVEGIVDEITLLSYAADSNTIDAMFRRCKPVAAKPVLRLSIEEQILPRDSAVSRLLSLPVVMDSRVPFKLNLPYRTLARMELYDIGGRRIEEILPLQVINGEMEIHWPQNLSTGVYFLRTLTTDEISIRKIILVN